tara:strand:- start:7324 stop:7500 length:177 start_codon:yes stop_codon:yes gene_type:complete
MKALFSFAILIVSLMGLQSCAVATAPVKIGTKAATTTIGVAGKTVGTGLEILDAPFED